jgi:hypothetical protein
LLPSLLENPSVREDQIVKLASSAMRDIIDILLKSPRVRFSGRIVDALKANPYLKKEEAEALEKSLATATQTLANSAGGTPQVSASTAAPQSSGQNDSVQLSQEPADENSDATFGAEDETVFSYLKEHADEIASEGEKPFQAIGGVLDLVLGDSSSAETAAEVPAAGSHSPAVPAATTSARAAAQAPAQGKPGGPPKRENTLQKINHLDVKGRIQLALKGNKEERSILIRDGTKVVALAVLDAPKISDGEVEKFASQKNVLEAVLRQIPLKRRFMKNYIVVRNLVANPRTPLDLSLGLMKNLLTQDLKNLSSNKEVSETIRKLALKMYKQKLEAANKK